MVAKIIFMFASLGCLYLAVAPPGVAIGWGIATRWTPVPHACSFMLVCLLITCSFYGNVFQHWGVLIVNLLLYLALQYLFWYDFNVRFPREGGGANIGLGMLWLAFPGILLLSSGIVWYLLRTKKPSC